ncbi:MAG: cyclic nucleotide-binding domain-containing protein [Geminicoccaceae bacterium]
MLQALTAHIASLPVRAFAPGEPLLQSGSRTGKLFFLKQGEVRVERDGVTVTRIREPGAVFGEMSLLLGGAHTADVIATEPTECHVLEAAGDSLATTPELTAYVAVVLAHRLDAVTRYLVDVKAQYAGADTQHGMIDEVLDSVLNRHPRALRLRPS